MIKLTVNINVLVTEKKLHPVNANSSDVTCIKNLATCYQKINLNYFLLDNVPLTIF